MVGALLLRGCATAGPESSTDHSGERDREDAACSSTKDWEASRDALGRLVTGPGLCRVVGVSKQKAVSPETNVELELTYDGLGQPIEANVWFSPHCPSDGPAGDLILSDEGCWTYEHHVQRWTWDERGRLVGAESLAGAEIEPEDRGDTAPEPDVPENLRCLFGDELVVRLTESWGYDDGDRLVAYGATYRGCEATQNLEEQLSYGTGVIESNVEIRDSSGSQSRRLRYHLDDCGRVIAIEGDPSLPQADYHGRSGFHYEYDLHGRLTKAVSRQGKEHRWSYEAGIAASLGPAWIQETASDSRTIWLAEDQPEGRRYEIRLDERKRVIAVESDHEAWTFSYDDCPNAELAQTRWQVGEMTSMWPFPTPTQPGEGYTALDGWLHEGPLLLSEL